MNTHEPFTLEPATGAELAAESDKIQAQRERAAILEEIARRQAQPLAPRAAQVSTAQAELFASGETLFSGPSQQTIQTRKETNR